jgi:hypothetical protein
MLVEHMSKNNKKFIKVEGLQEKEKMSDQSKFAMSIARIAKSDLNTKRSLT